MGLTMPEIAQMVLDLEPPRCPVCQTPDFADSAAVQVLQPPEGEVGEAIIISYHCKGCDILIHTFA